MTTEATGAPPGAPEPDEATVLGWLGALPSRSHFAAMLRDDGVLMVHQQDPAPQWPVGPAFELLLGLHALAGDQARRWSRRRLWTSLDRPLDRAAVQVGGRRGRFGVPLGDRGRPIPTAAPPMLSVEGAIAGALDRMAPVALGGGPPVRLARELAARARRDGPRTDQDRSVGAVLVDPFGRAVLGATNQAREHRLLHAEVVVLLSAQRVGGPLGPGHRLLTSLQPCRLCAALAVEVGVQEVVYEEPERGRFGQFTALAQAGLERQATAAERADPDG